MTRKELNLSPKNSKKLDKIENKIFGYSSLDKRMDYVDELSLSFIFDDLSDEEVDNIDEYIRDLVV